jgi:hypothetical protein
MQYKQIKVKKTITKNFWDIQFSYYKNNEQLLINEFYRIPNWIKSEEKNIKMEYEKKVVEDINKYFNSNFKKDQLIDIEIKKINN